MGCLKESLPTAPAGFAVRTLLITFLLILTQQMYAYATSPSILPNNRNVLPEMGNCCIPILLAPISASGNDVYIVWTNNDTGHWGVFFAKSTDGGKTFKTSILSVPIGNGHVVNQNAEITSSRSSVFVTWWTNNTGTFQPVFRASIDNGDTFEKTIRLNSTSAP
jgi:hypothetical protein